MIPLVLKGMIELEIAELEAKFQLALDEQNAAWMTSDPIRAASEDDLVGLKSWPASSCFGRYYRRTHHGFTILRGADDNARAIEGGCYGPGRARGFAEQKAELTMALYDSGAR